MDDEARLKLYEQSYLHEIDRREKINARLTVPLAICLALLGFIAWLLQHLLVISKQSTPPIVAWCFLGTAFLAIVTAMYYFFKTWSGYTDELLATPEELEKYFHELQEFEKDKANKEFKYYLLDCYKTYTSKNIRNNDNRSANVNSTSYYLMIAICLAFLSYFTSIIESGINAATTEPEKVKCMTSESQQHHSSNKPITSPPTPPGPRRVKGDVPLPPAKNEPKKKG